MKRINGTALPRNRHWTADEVRLLRTKIGPHLRKKILGCAPCARKAYPTSVARLKMNEHSKSSYRRHLAFSLAVKRWSVAVAVVTIVETCFGCQAYQPSVANYFLFDDAHSFQLNAHLQMKTMVDSAECSDALFRKFGPQPDFHPVVCEIENALIQYVHHQIPERVQILKIAPSISILHFQFLKISQTFEVILTFSETETEIIRLSLLVVELPVEQSSISKSETQELAYA